ncbi:MAG TPA: hypothetical protein VF635_15435 [Propionibacteriaceae bacterium]|jgi:hypothetical protein
MHVSTLMAEVLDPVMTASVFAAGQNGLAPDDVSGHPCRSDDRWPNQSGSVIWCATAEELQQKLPALPQFQAEGVGEHHGCVDLTVTIAHGNLTEVDFEGLSLAETFTALGRGEDAHAAEHLLGAPAKAASERLATLLASLLAPAAD